MTNEILPAILGVPAYDPAGRMPRLGQFLQQQFHCSPGSPPQSYPGLPMLMSLLDTAIDRRQALDPAWDANSILEIRRSHRVGHLRGSRKAGGERIPSRCALRRCRAGILVQAQTNNRWQLLNQVYRN